MQNAQGYKLVTAILRVTRGERHLTLLEQLGKAGMRNAVAVRAVAATGPGGELEVQRLVDFVVELPLVVTWVATAEEVERLLPLLRSLVAPGIVAVSDVDVPLYATETPDLPLTLRVADVMTRDVVAVTPETPIREVVLDLVTRQFRAVPVIDSERRVVGIVTNGDLVRRGGLPLRLELLRSFDTAALHEQLEAMSAAHAAAGEVMTSAVVTVAPQLDVQHAANLMRVRRLKRLPVVDEDRRLLGIVSRVDLLRSIAHVPSAPEGTPHGPSITGNGLTPVAQIMTTVVPAVRGEATVPELLNAVMSTRLNCAFVVDERRHVVGLISDAELVERLTPQARPSAFSAVMHRLPFVHGSHEAEETLRHTTGTVARDLMRSDVLVLPDTAPLRDVLASMLSGGAKVAAVTDAGGELRGIVDRADLLAVLVGP